VDVPQRETTALRFTAREIELVRGWFRDPRHLEGLPPGLAKRGDLPPGLERQLRRNGRLPPGLEAKLHPLPVDLEVLLPRLPPGVRRVIVGGDLLLLDERSSAILDIVRGVVRLADTF
jgi:hypothetical protein